MSRVPIFAVVGHPNKGKSSVVATLSQNDAIAIAMEPGTTRQSHRYPLSVDGRTLYTLVDTPGFQRPRRVLEWLEAHSLSASDRPETVSAFVTQHRGDARYADECELLEPLIQGAGIIYVVDGSVPYSPAHEAEMTILRWSGRPSLALINSIGRDDHGDAWQSALGQFFQVVKRFDAVRAPFEQHLSLLRAFGQLEPAWETPLEQATRYLSDQRQRRQTEAAALIATALEEMMSYRASLTLPRSETGEPAEKELAEGLRQQWYQHQRKRERTLRQDVEQLYQHHRIRRQEAELSWHGDHDLFSEHSQKLWGVNRRYLATAGFGAGAVGGAGIDALTFGTSLGTGALVGGLLGAAGSYFYGDRLTIPILKTGPLGGGLTRATFGPVQDTRFGYIVLGRAVDHWWHISQRNHAGRDPLDLAPTDDHWLDGLSRAQKHLIQRVLERCRKGRPPDHRLRQEFHSAIGLCLEHYNQWRLDQAGQ